VRNGLVIPTGEAVAEALATIPAGYPWPWACLRILPMLRGERIAYLSDDEMEEVGFYPATDVPSLEVPPGVRVTFGIEVDPVLITVRQEQLDAWDRTPATLWEPALANLRRAASDPIDMRLDSSFHGIPIRTMDPWPHWAASLLVAPDELMRIFGTEDQLFVVPYHCLLLSMPIDVDRDDAADLVDTFAMINPQSLLIGLPAFVLRDGRLSVEPLPGLEHADEGDDELEEARAAPSLADLLGVGSDP
jgi:hypothetical protein